MLNLKRGRTSLGLIFAVMLPNLRLTAPLRMIICPFQTPRFLCDQGRIRISPLQGSAISRPLFIRTYLCQSLVVLLALGMVVERSARLAVHS